MYEKKTIADYSNRLGKHHQIPNKLVLKILRAGFINILKMMVLKQDIRIGPFFRIVTDKNERAAEILRKREINKQHINKWLSQSESEAKADPEKQPH